MQVRLARWIAVAWAASGAAAALAQAPPAWPATRGAEAVATSDPVRALHIGTLRVVLDATTLADVQRALATGAPAHQGQGTEALDWLCYTLAAATPPQRLWLSSSELAGGTRIDGLTAVELAPDERPSPACPELPARFREVHFDDGFWLGAGAPELRKSFGLPLKASGAWSSVFHGLRGTGDIISSVVIDVRRGRAAAVYMARGGQN